MSVSPVHIKSYQDLIERAQKGKTTLAECFDAHTGEPTTAICVIRQNGEEVEMIPIARMIDGDPYAQLAPPDTGDAPPTL
jgi:hypothetical protein